MKQLIVIGGIFVAVVGGYFMFLSGGSQPTTSGVSASYRQPYQQQATQSAYRPQVNTRTRAS